MAWYACLVLLAGSSYGLVSACTKSAYANGLGVIDVTNSQFEIGALVLWVIALFWRTPGRIRGKQWWVLTVLGVAGACVSYFYYKSLTLLPASLAIVLLFQFTWIVMVIDIFVKKRMPGLEKWIGVVLIFLGTIFSVGLLGSDLGASKLNWPALIYGILSAIGYAITLYLSSYVDTRPSPALRSAIVVTISAAITAVFVPPTYLHSIFSGIQSHVVASHSVVAHSVASSVHPAGYGRELWIWGGLVALFSQVLPLIFMQIGIPKVGGRMAGILGAIELPVAVLGAWIFLGETVTGSEWVGVVLILIGIVVSEWNVVRPRKADVKQVQA